MCLGGRILRNLLIIPILLIFFCLILPVFQDRENRKMQEIELKRFCVQGESMHELENNDLLEAEKAQIGTLADSQIICYLKENQRICHKIYYFKAGDCFKVFGTANDVDDSVCLKQTDVNKYDVFIVKNIIKEGCE